MKQNGENNISKDGTLCVLGKRYAIWNSYKEKCLEVLLEDLCEKCLSYMTNRWRLSFNEIARSNYCSGYRLVISLIKMNVLDRHVGFDERLLLLSGQEVHSIVEKIILTSFFMLAVFINIFYNLCLLNSRTLFKRILTFHFSVCHILQLQYTYACII